MKKLLPIFAILLLAITSVSAKDIFIDPEISFIQNNNYYYKDGQGKAVNIPIEPGDNLVLLGRADNSRNHLYLRAVWGTKEKPITVTHEAGKIVNINDHHNSGIYLANCKYINIDGGRNSVPRTDSSYYGIQIRVTDAGQVIKADNGTNYLRIERVWIDVPESVKATDNSAAIMVKSNVKCDNDVARYSEHTWLLQDLYIMNNRIDNASGEAIYLGETGDGIKGKCGSTVYLEMDFNQYTGELLNLKELRVDTSLNDLQPHYLDNVHVVGNLIQNPGWDGIQLSRCHNFVVRDNTVFNYGTKETGHKMGIIIGEGCSGDVYNNIIDKGTGWAIFTKPSGSISIFNNVINLSGQTGSMSSNIHCAIYALAENLSLEFTKGKNAQGPKTINITHNLITYSKGHGIRINNAIPGENTATGVSVIGFANVLANAIIQSGGMPVDKQISDFNFNLPFPLHRNLSRANYSQGTLSDLKLVNTIGYDSRLWDVRPSTGSPLIDKAPPMRENIEYPDIYGQLRSPFVTVPKVNVVSGAGAAADFGPAERILPYIKVNLPLR